jgi:hypothetical protein
MALVELTKKQVIEAIRKEPRLRYCRWVGVLRPSGGTSSLLAERQDKPPPARKCTFCAVGAVVRAAMATTTPVTLIAEAAADGGGDDASPLSALSEAFEGACSETMLDVTAADAEAGRKAAIDHVRKNFPARVRIDIGAAKPRRGMKVVG